MLTHYLKIAWRNIWNDKFYSAINLIGLTVAFTVVFLFVQWIRHELTYETDHVNAKRIYRVEEAEKRADGIHSKTIIRPGRTLDLKDKFPSIEEVVSVYNERLAMIVEEAIMYWHVTSTSNFFKVFPMKCVEGTTANAEKNNGGTFISEEAAKRIYGSSSKALGKEIEYLGGYTIIEGVIRVPSNSVISFDILYLTPHSFADRSGGLHYLMLKDNIDFNADLQATIAQFPKSYDSENTYTFTKLKDIHFKDENRIKEMQIFLGVITLLLILAIINYVNTSTARAMSRAKEVGVRKISGSNRKQLIVRFLTEAFIISFIAVFLAFDIAKVLHHPFENIINSSFSFKLSGFLILLGFGICLFTTILAGGYAAFYLSSLNPIRVLAGGATNFNSKITLRKILLIIQFIISIGVLICTWTIYRQLNYLLNRDLGFNKENIYIWDTSLTYNSEDFIAELKKSPSIINATMAMQPPYNVKWGYSGVKWENAPTGTEKISFAEINCDHRFADTFELSLMQGEFLPPGLTWWQDINENSFSIVINETFRKLLDVDNPIGMTIEYGGSWQVKGKIIGVVRDFEFKPLSNEKAPLIIRFNPEFTNKMFIKHVQNQEKNALKHIRATYDKMKETNRGLSKRPFMLKSMEVDYKEMFKPEVRLQKLLFIFSLLSVVLSFMGIVSMVAFIIEKRTKEIGIRKINGAKWLDIVREFWREFLLLISIATVPAVLISYWFMHNWLQQYVYRSAFGWWVFILVPLFIVALTALILYWQVQSIAKRNPVECLKSE